LVVVADYREFGVVAKQVHHRLFSRVQVLVFIDEHIRELRPLFGIRVVAEVRKSQWHDFTDQHRLMPPEGFQQRVLKVLIESVDRLASFLDLLPGPGCLEGTCQLCAFTELRREIALQVFQLSPLM
jgi:hypothetical protein